MIADLILRVEMTFAQCPLLYHDEEYGHKDKDLNGRGNHAANNWSGDRLHDVGADAGFP